MSIIQCLNYYNDNNSIYKTSSGIDIKTILRNQIKKGLKQTFKKIVTRIKVNERNNFESNFSIRKKIIRVKLKRYKNINKKRNDFLKEQMNNNNNKKYEKQIITC